MLVPQYREPLTPEQVKIHVVVPFYNCQRWITRCLYSISDQTHERVNVVVVDDCSKDSGGTYAKMMCEANGWTYHRTEENQKCPHNLVVGIELTKAAPRDVIFLLDGDDYLPHSGVLARFAQIFAEADTWMTYGQYMSDPPHWGCAPAVPTPLEATWDRSFRKVAPVFFNHPIVFRKFLWDSIPESEFRDNQGNWFLAGYDRTIVYPLMERATDLPRSGQDGESQQEVHWKFLNEVAYVYNSENPCSDWRMNSEATERVNIVHDRPPLKPLKVRDE